MHSKLSIIIPSFNEEKRIKNTLDEYWSYFLQYESSVEMIVVMDGCNDQTPNIVKQFSNDHKGIKVLEFPRHLGKGGAILESLPFVRGDFIGYVDADGSSKAKDFIKLVTCIESEGWDGVIGSRWLDGAEIAKKQPLFRKFLSRGLNVLVKMLFKLKFKDTQCGAKVFKRTLIEACLPYIDTTGFTFDINLLYVATKKGFKIKEVPLRWEDMAGSKVGFGNVLRMFLDICRVWLKYRCF